MAELGQGRVDPLPPVQSSSLWPKQQPSLPALLEPNIQTLQVSPSTPEDSENPYISRKSGPTSSFPFLTWPPNKPPLISIYQGQKTTLCSLLLLHLRAGWPCSSASSSLQGPLLRPWTPARAVSIPLVTVAKKTGSIWVTHCPLGLGCLGLSSGVREGQGGKRSASRNPRLSAKPILPTLSSSLWDLK